MVWGQLTAEYRPRLHGRLELDARPYDPSALVGCVDEQSKQLLQETRVPQPARPGLIAKQDYAYERADTRHLCVSVEPKGQRRPGEVTARRPTVDCVSFVSQLAQAVYAHAQKIHRIVDNLNPHFRARCEAVLGPAAATLLARVEFHDTPQHVRWLNLAGLVIGILEKPCTGRRMPTQTVVAAAVAAWQPRRNEHRLGIPWKFTREKADQKLGRHYVT